jgi:hypothetical protein
MTRWGRPKSINLGAEWLIAEDGGPILRAFSIEGDLTRLGFSFNIEDIPLPVVDRLSAHIAEVIERAVNDWQDEEYEMEAPG